MMRTLLLLLAAVAAITNVLSGQPPEARPFGKYLVSVCTLPSSGAAKCDVPGASPVAIDQNTPQTITIKQVGCAANTTPCPDPIYPPKVGDKFWVQAVSDSGLPVTQDVEPGTVNASATGLTAGGVREYQVSSPGNIVILANSPASGNFADAAPVTLTLLAVPAVAAPGSGDPTCKGLFSSPTAAAVVKHFDASGIISLIGSPTPYVLVAQGKNVIFIYSTRLPAVPPDPLESAILNGVITQIVRLSAVSPDALGVASPKPFQVELSITHAAALGDPAARISALNYSQFTVKDIGSDRVGVSSTAQPACSDLTAFLTAVRHLEWQVTPEPWEMKLYYLSSTDAATAFTSLGGSGGSAAAAAPAAASPAASSIPAAAAGNATISVTQPPGSFFDIRTDTTPCVFAGLALSNSSACTGTSTTAAASSGSPASSGSTAAGVAKPQPIGMAAMAVAAGTIEQNPSDLLVFSDATPGDDAQILERKRILALLDLPRPEMLINAWVMQNSTANSTAMGKFNDAVKNLVTQYNESVENVALRGWESVSRRIKSGNYFDEAFYHYIADHYIADSYSNAKAKAPQDAAQSFLDDSTAGLADEDATRQKLFGICKKGSYCLGYDSLFQPLKPHLTDFLLTLIASNDPLGHLLGAINDVETDTPTPMGTPRCPGDAKQEDKKDASPPQPPPCPPNKEHQDVQLTEKTACDGLSGRDAKDRCRAIWSNLGLDKSSTPRNCVTNDFQQIFTTLDRKTKEKWNAPSVHLDCLRGAANIFLQESGAELMKADLADFLFNYKMSQQYPHEFIPYDLSQSADALNSALAPVIDAFNRDIVAYQTFMRADLQYQVDRLNNNSDQRCCVKRLFGIDKPFFFDDGLVSVRTISGQPTSINTTSQSFLDASSAPTLANLANNIASSGAGSGSGTSPLAAVLGSKQPSASLLTGVLNSYQTTYAQIGRMLNLQVTPRSLSTASSAEISVTLAADETAGGATYSGGPQGASSPNTSRVANFDTTTRIRVESVKLFEFASFSAIVERSRQKFPLLPPFVEIPYVGTLIGVPIPGAKEYHSSMAVMSAMVVPTAADIAYGLRFTFDQVLDGADGGATSCSYLTSPISGSAGPGVTVPCRFKRAVSIRDLRAPVNRFHRAMIRCFATGMATPYSGYASLSTSHEAPLDSACKNLSFDRVAQDSH